MALTKKKVSEMPLVDNINNYFVFGFSASQGSARASMSQLRGNTGPAPNITISVIPVAYGSIPTVVRTGTAENPVFTIGFPLAKNGEKPLFQKNGNYIQYKYESDSEWINLISLDELRFHYSDLTSEQIAELQKPALDAAESAGIAIQNAVNAASAASQAAQSATDAAINAENATATATSAAGAANTAAENTLGAKNMAEEAAKNAPKIVNGEWWMYDLSAHEYKNSGLPSRGPAGKPPIILPNGHYGYWMDSEGYYVDSGIKAEIHTEFETGLIRENILSGESIPDILGRISKWFEDFGPLAWKIRDIDHEPGEDDLTYPDGDVTRPFETGAEVRYVDPDGNVTFYKLYAVTVENRAQWEEMGGISLSSNIYLSGANYYNENVQIINQGILNGN